MLTASQRPWAAKIRTSKASIGVGAFNLVRREAYDRAGTHKSIAMRPDDDLKLAACIKNTEGRADVLYGRKELQLEWYANVREFINGLMKNTFSGFNYNLFSAIGAALGVFLFFVLPIPVLLAVGKFPEKLTAACIFLVQAILYAKMPGSEGKWWYAFLSMYGGAVICYIIIRSAIITLGNGGIYWRGTFYSLSELRKFK